MAKEYTYYAYLLLMLLKYMTLQERAFLERLLDQTFDYLNANSLEHPHPHSVWAQFTSSQVFKFPEKPLRS